MERDCKAGAQQHQTHKQSGDRFGTPVAVGMVPVRWFGSQSQSQKYQPGGQDVAGRLESIGHDGSRTGHQANDNLEERQRGADDHAAERDLLADAHDFSVTVAARRLAPSVYTVENFLLTAAGASPLEQ